MITHYRLTTSLWKKLQNYFLKKMHSLWIMNFWSQIYGLISWLDFLKFQELNSTPNCL